MFLRSPTGNNLTNSNNNGNSVAMHNQACDQDAAHDAHLNVQGAVMNGAAHQPVWFEDDAKVDHQDVAYEKTPDRLAFATASVPPAYITPSSEQTVKCDLAKVDRLVQGSILPASPRADGKCSYTTARMAQDSKRCHHAATRSSKNLCCRNHTCSLSDCALPKSSKTKCCTKHTATTPTDQSEKPAHSSVGWLARTSPAAPYARVCHSR